MEFETVLSKGKEINETKPAKLVQADILERFMPCPLLYRSVRAVLCKKTHTSYTDVAISRPIEGVI